MYSSEDIYNADDMQEFVDDVDVYQQEGSYVFHTDGDNNLPYILDRFPPEFRSKNIWINLYDQLCNRLFVPADAASTDSALLDGTGISEVDPAFWPLYEEYGLHRAVPYGNATALHVRPLF